MPSSGSGRRECRCVGAPTAPLRGRNIGRAGRIQLRRGCASRSGCALNFANAPGNFRPFDSHQKSRSAELPVVQQVLRGRDRNDQRAVLQRAGEQFLLGSRRDELADARDELLHRCGSPPVRSVPT